MTRARADPARSISSAAAVINKMFFQAAATYVAARLL